MILGATMSSVIDDVRARYVEREMERAQNRFYTLLARWVSEMEPAAVYDRHGRLIGLTSREQLEFSGSIEGLTIIC
jgi:hypothetical protein